MNGAPSTAQFIGEKHVLVAAAGTGHGMQSAEDALEAAMPQQSISIRVPSFTAAALAAKRTDAIVTLPSPLAAVLARELDMEIFRPPLRLPKFEVSQCWHERLHREPGNQWMRTLLQGLSGSQSQFAADLPA
jgi:DNA-binding transcriptional LysR family regulator